MSQRHLARTLALQTLYEWDFFDGKHDPLEILERNLIEIAPQLEEKDFYRIIVNGILEHRKDIDKIITVFAPDWPLDKITTVDRNVLRMGVFELMWNTDIPSKVAINEAIEVAKTFGGESSGKFVNGVLGAVYRSQIEKGVVKEADKPKEEKGIVSEKPEKKA
ncbi:MAG: transcription antitermination factor NusB [bacterium]|nr:transcription antitermination factor NusB [bacterium]